MGFRGIILVYGDRAIDGSHAIFNQRLTPAEYPKIVYAVRKNKEETPSATVSRSQKIRRVVL